MDIQINGKTFEVPFSLSLISLRQCIEYYERYGKGLEEERIKLEERIQALDEVDQIIELEKFIDKCALAWFSFWTGFDFFEEQNPKFTDAVKSQFRVLQELLHNEDEIFENIGKEISWHGQVWCVSDFKDCDYELMNFNQIKLFRRTLYHIELVRKNKWDAMIYLCALFFRKKNEAVEDLLIYSKDPDKILDHPALDPERVELLKDLPMNIVMSIKALVSIMMDEADVRKIFHRGLNSDQPVKTLSWSIMDPEALQKVKVITDSWTQDLATGKITQEEYDRNFLNLVTSSDEVEKFLKKQINQTELSCHYPNT